MNSKVEVFNNVLEKFEDEEMRLFCEDLIAAQPDMNFSMPSSTSYKYHNATQCNPGGQAYHVLMVGTIMNYILELEYIQEKFKPLQRDCMRIAALCHDIMKTNGGQYTVHEHPILGGEYVLNTEVEHDIDVRYKQYIARLIESHSGQWTSSNRSQTVLPKPENDAQFFVHLADYLGSRNNLDMIYSEQELDSVRSFIKVENPFKLKMPFGKHAGMELGEIPISYLKWAKDNMDSLREPYKTAIDTVLEKAK